jgi:hypothetical protein
MFKGYSLLPGKNQGIFDPHNVCSLRWAFSAPFMQKELFFRPNSGVSGHAGQMHAFCSEMHMKLFPIKQKTSYFAFLAQVV